jgi:hypothetical protein
MGLEPQREEPVRVHLWGRNRVAKQAIHVDKEVEMAHFAPRSQNNYGDVSADKQQSLQRANSHELNVVIKE